MCGRFYRRLPVGSIGIRRCGSANVTIVSEAVIVTYCRAVAAPIHGYRVAHALHLMGPELFAGC